MARAAAVGLGVKKRRPGLGMVERALIAEQWRKNVSTSRIHALIGQDSKVLVEQAGRVFYVVLGAACIEQLPDDSADVRIMRGAVNALHEQAGVEEIDHLRRKSIEAGLEAAVRILNLMPHPTIVRAACEMHMKLCKSDVSLAEFQELISKLGASEQQRVSSAPSGT